jgi:hypothetical protein
MAPAMTLKVEPELGVQLTPEVRTLDLPVRVEAMANTAKALAGHGLDLHPNKEDEGVAATVSIAYAEKPEETSKKVTSKRAAKLTPPSLVLTNNILQEFGHSVAESATQIRHLVTNKLIEETENPDPRVRIRALELLGKISDVGLFTEKTEITITHQTTDDLKEKLRLKLAKLVNPTPDAESTVVIDGEPIDVDAELGLKDEDEQVFDDDAENNAEADSENAMQDPEPQAPMPEKADKDMEAAMKEALEDDLVQENDPKWGQ